MKSWPCLALLVACTAGAPALAQSEKERLEAIASVIGLDMSAEAMIDYCERAAPDAASGLRPQWLAWRADALLPQVSQALGPDKLGQLRGVMGSVATSAVGKLKQMGPPQTACPQIAGWLKEGPFVTRTAYPALYAGLPAAGSITTPATRLAAPPATATATGGGVYYTPAQLTALVQSWFGPANDVKRARRMMDQAGRIYIQGKVVRMGDAYLVQTNDGVFRSRVLVSTGLDLDRYEGRTITVEADLKELPGGMAWLKDTRIVDPAGLKPSPLPTEPGLTRLQVSAAQITAAPGAGLKPAQVHGLLHHGYGTTGSSGYEFREEIFLLLKDGTAYLGEDVAPSDLDVAKSRKLEPQLWGRWRQAGGGFQIQRSDDFGRPEAWSDQAGRLIPTWKPGQRLDATYTSTSFHGSLALGGTYNSTSYKFSADGRFEVIGYRQSGSGSMAANAGFSGGGAGYSDGKGSTASAGGGSAGAFASSQRRSNDGSGNRGVYRLDGLSLELKFDDGRTETVLCAPWSADLKGIYMQGRTFSRN